MSEKISSRLFCASGKAKLSRKLAVVIFPGMAILAVLISASAIGCRAISSGPHPLPQALARIEQSIRFREVRKGMITEFGHGQFAGKSATVERFHVFHHGFERKSFRVYPAMQQGVENERVIGQGEKPG